MAKIKMIRESDNASFIAEIGYMIPEYDFLRPNMDVLTVGSDQYCCTKSGGQTGGTDYGAWEIGKISPILSYDAVGNVSNEWFKIGDKFRFKLLLTTTTARILEFWYNGQKIGSTGSHEIYNIGGSPTWGEGKKLAIMSQLIQGRHCLMFIVYTQASDRTAYTDYIWVCGFTENCLTSSAYPQPYAGGGDATGDPEEQGGWGDGTPDGSSGIPAPTQEQLTTVVPIGTGVHVYLLTQAQYNDLNNYLWGRISSVFDVNGLWKKWENYKFNPIAAIIACHHIPTEFIPENPVTVNSIAVAGIDLDISAQMVSNQFVEWTSLRLQFSEFVGGFMDYTNVTFKVHTPFCGTLEIDPVYILANATPDSKGWIAVVYVCDIVTGNLTASVVCDDGSGNSIYLAHATSNCAYHIPITGSDGGMGAIEGVITHGAASYVSQTNLSRRHWANDPIPQMYMPYMPDRFQQITNHGNFAGNVGWNMGMQTWLEVIREVPMYAKDYNHIVGRPSYVSGAVSDFEGFAQFIVDDVEIEGATFSERLEIQKMLRDGVYV